MAVVWLFMVGLAVSWAAEEGAQEPVSPANNLLFMSDHLADLRQPAVVHYEFRKSGNLEEGFADTIDMSVTGIAPDGTKNVELQYFTGERAQQFPLVPNARGNPVLLLFLQRDVGEMQRLTEGNWRYFQRVIKTALADEAEVQPVEFDFQGRSVKGTQIKITPYVNDPHQGLKKFNTKYYLFTLSEAVPGRIYQMKSVIPEQEQGRNGVLVEETVTFRGIEPLAQR